MQQLAGGTPPARQLRRADLRNKDGEIIDRCMVVSFPGPGSFTGEDCAELHLHGGRAVVSAVLDALSRMEGLRHAEAGEFTRRAYLHGKMDLTGAEALADLIESETESQRRLAVENASGRQGRLYDGWRRRILQARAMIEAELDFSDEGDVPGSVAKEVWRDIGALAGELSEHIEGSHHAEILREGYKVAILGAPNVGKSTLLNALARRDVAIVTDEPGTTRDILTVNLDLGGYKVILSDTAGIRDEAGKIEQIGIERALQTAQQADLVLLASEVGEAPVVPFATFRDCLRVGTKADKYDSANVERYRSSYDLVLSAETGEGMADLITLLARRVEREGSHLGDALPSTKRQVDLLRHCLRELERALISNQALELRAEGLRLAGVSLGRITGSIDVEEVLGEIFGRFCIGK